VPVEVVRPMPTKVTAPLGAPLSAREDAPHVSEAQATPKRKTVLLIGADPDSPEMAGQALRQGGYNVLVASAGFTGYLTAMRERPDLILLDMNLSYAASGPDACLDGRGLLKMLSKLPSNRALPFIGLVPDGACEAQKQVLASGAKACLQKSSDGRQVLGAIRNVLDELASKAEMENPPAWSVRASV
jgi:CheY-like chemotaxis protein